MFTFQSDATDGNNAEKEDVVTSDTETNTSVVYNNYPTLSVEQILDKTDTLSVRYRLKIYPLSISIL